MTADTKVRAASISKVLVGMAASLSAEEGTMTLDTELDTYLGFPSTKHRKETTLQSVPFSHIHLLSGHRRMYQEAMRG